MYDPLHNAKLGTAGSRISAHLIFRGHLWPLRQDFELAGVPTGKGLEGLFHNAVFERMKRDDAEPSTRGQDIRCITERRFEVIQLFIDGDAKRLESTRRTMNASTAIMSWHCGFNYRYQFPSRRNRPLLPSANECSSNPPRISLLTPAVRSEERRVGKECRSRWWRYE